MVSFFAKRPAALAETTHDKKVLLMRAVFLDHSSLDLGDLNLGPLQDAFSELHLHPVTPQDDVAQRLKGYEVAITNKVVIDAHAIRTNPQLKLILVAATGTNNVDLEAAKAQDITVCNCQGYGTSSVAQHTFSLLLALATSLPRYQQAVTMGKWEQASQFCLLDYPIVELEGKTMGILGYGELGSAVARLAQAFGMNVLIGELPDRPPQPNRTPLDVLLPQVDVLTLHCPLNETTRNLIGAAELALLKPGAFLINTGRGGLVNEQALANTLRNGRLGGAALDVLTTEPPVNGNPLLASDLQRLIITPHIAWGSREARQRIVVQLAESAHNFASGEKTRAVA